MTFYSVNIPVSASVVVYVEADNAEEAEEIAAYNADLSKVEPHAFMFDNVEVEEIDKKSIPARTKIYKNKVKK